MADKQHLHKLLSDAIPLLCRNGLPPSVSFRVEALIGITILDDAGGDAVGDGNVAILSFKQTVSDDGVIASQFGSNDPVSTVPDDGSTSHASRKRKAPTATVSVKQEYFAETSVKQEIDAESYPAYTAGNSYEEYEEGVEYVGEDGDYDGEEEYYDDDGQYYDDGSSDMKYDPQHSAYMQAADEGSYMKTEYMTEDYGQSSVGGRPPTQKVSKPRQSTQPGSSRGRKIGGTSRGAARPKTGRASLDPAAAMALAAGATGSTNQRGMLSNLARTIADQSEVASKFFCHICNACLANKQTLVNHIKGSHLAANMITCDECGATFKWTMQLYRHRRRFHGFGSDHHDDGNYHRGDDSA